MKHVIIIDKDVPKEHISEGMAVLQALHTGKCDICTYLKQCEIGFEDTKFPSDAACMKILNRKMQNTQ